MVMARTATRRIGAPPQLNPEIGPAAVTQKFSINLSGEVGSKLKRIAFEERVSESSIIEIALRQLLLRVPSERIGAFLKLNGACLRRRV
jgi:hypothetical protein